jgi:hypothetical protein
MLESTSGIPTSFWRDPYAVGFVTGYVMGAALFVAGKRIDAATVTQASTDVLFELAPNEAFEVAKRHARWHETGDRNFTEGQTNGAILAMFLLSNAADKEPVVIEARRRSQQLSGVFASLPTQTDERGRVGSVLRQMFLR